MTSVQCRNCFAGNPETASVCHNCRARLRRLDAAPATPLRGMVIVPDADLRDDHMLETAQAVQRAREACVVRRALATAAVICVLRATVVPLVFAFAPAERFAAFTAPTVTFFHYFFAVAFAGCYAWSRRDPFKASLAATFLYLAVAVPQVLLDPALLGGGHLGKVVMLAVLGRAVSAGIIYRTLFGSPIRLPSQDAPVPRRAAA